MKKNPMTKDALSLNTLKVELGNALNAAEFEIARVTDYLDRLTAQHLERTQQVVAYQDRDLYTIYEMRASLKDLYDKFATCLEKLKHRLMRDRAFVERRRRQEVDALDTILRYDSYLDKCEFWTDAVERLRTHRLCDTDVSRAYNLVQARAKRALPVRGPVKVAAYVRPQLRYNGERIETIVERTVQRAVDANQSIYTSLNEKLVGLMQRQSLSRPTTLDDLTALITHVSRQLDESRKHLEAARRNVLEEGDTARVLNAILAKVEDTARLESMFERFYKILRDENGDGAVARVLKAVTPLQAAFDKLKTDAMSSLDAVNANVNQLSATWTETRKQQSKTQDDIRDLLEKYTEHLTRVIVTSEELASTVLKELSSQLKAHIVELFKDVHHELAGYTDQVATKLLEYAVSQETNVKESVAAYLNSVLEAVGRVDAAQKERIDTFATEVGAFNERFAKQETSVATILKLLGALETSSSSALKENVESPRKRKRWDV